MGLKDSGSRQSLSKRQLLIGGAATTVATVGWRAGAGPAPLSQLPTTERLAQIRPEAYPAFSRAELGMLDYMHRKATAKPGDWSLWEPSELFDGKVGVAGIESEGVQYDLFRSSFAVAHAVNKTPAYREFAETVLGGIVDKGLDDRAWRYWTENAAGSGNDGLYIPYSPDPIAHSDAMYVGNMAGSIAYHALMTDSRRFEQKQAFSYQGAGVTIGGRTVKTGDTWRHDWRSISDTLATQIMTSEKRMVMCQIPTVYFMCNLSIAQSLLAYDRVSGSKTYSPMLYGKRGFFDVTGEEMFDPPRSVGGPLKRVIFGQRVVDGGWKSSPAHSLGDLALVSGLYPAKPDWAKAAYDMNRRRWFKDEGDGAASWIAEVGVPATPILTVAATVSGLVGAAFVGDADARRQNLAWMDEHHGPIWDGASMVYSLGYSDPRDSLRAGALQAGMLCALSCETGSPMANFAFDRSRFAEPTLAGARYPDVTVSRATFDREASALVVSLAAKTATTVRVLNLRPDSQARILLKGVEPQTVTVPRGPEGLRISMPAGRHDLVVGVQV